MDIPLTLHHCALQIYRREVCVQIVWGKCLQMRCVLVRLRVCVCMSGSSYQNDTQTHMHHWHYLTHKMHFPCFLFVFLHNKTIQDLQTNKIRSQALLCKAKEQPPIAYILVLRQYCSSTGLVLSMQCALCTLCLLLNAIHPQSSVTQCVLIFSTMGISPSVRQVSLRELWKYSLLISTGKKKKRKNLFWEGEVETWNISESCLVCYKMVENKNSMGTHKHNTMQGLILTLQIIWKFSICGLKIFISFFFSPRSMMDTLFCFCSFVCTHSHTYSTHNGFLQ